MLTKDACMALK